MILVKDNVMSRENLLAVRNSAISSGFNTWSPPSHSFGSGIYQGMNWKGHNSAMHLALAQTIGSPIFPNQSFFRILTENEDKRLIHSDRLDGSFTAIAYISEHDHEYHGTAFYRHIETDLLEMPTVEEMDKEGSTETWNQEMTDDSKWEQTDFIRGQFGRMLVFSAPLFHARVPDRGIGTTPEDSRMIWVSHFEI